MPADRMPADTSANKDSNSNVAANAPMSAPPMTMLKKAMVMASKKILNSSSGWGMEGSVTIFALVVVSGLVVVVLLAPVLVVLVLVVLGFALAESVFEPG